MKAESLYIQKLTYDENTGNEIIGLFPSEDNPAIVSSYTYDAKRMGGAPTLTATIYSSEPLQWKKEEFVEYNGDRFFASYTPNSTKDNSSRMWKNEITFTSRRELLDNTLFFDVVVDDVDTQNKDRYRSNQTKFTFGGTIYEFVARINSSMAYCGLYRPTDEYKGYYVVVDEGYGTDEVKEVSFEDQYLTDVLQLVNTTFELDYYWDGNVCHVGKVQNDLTDTPIKYGCSDALISVSKENANYKIVDMITGYGSSDNLPYYYPNDDEFGEAIFEAKNIASEHVDVTLSDYLRYSKYNDNLVLFKSKNGKYEGNVDVSTLYVRNTYSPENLTQADNIQNPKVKCWFWVSLKINAKKGQIIDFSKISFNFELFDYVPKKENITNLSSAKRTINVYTTYHDIYKNVCTDSNFGDTCSVEFTEDGTFYIDIEAIFSYNCKVFTMDGKKTFHNSSSWKVSFSGDAAFSLETNSEYSWKNGDKYIPLDNSGIYVNGIASAKYVEYDYNFVKNDEGIYGFENIYTGTEDDAVQVSVTGRKWIAPSSVLMPSIYRNTKGAERFYYALNNNHKLPSGSGYYEFVNLYKKGNPHQGTVTFDDIKPTINGIVNTEGQLFGEIADVAFDSNDSDVKDSDGKYIHNYFYIKLHKFNGDFGFDLFNHVLAKEPAKINLIKSNGCPACSFVIHNQPSADNSKCYNCVSVDENGNLKPVRTDKNDYIFANASDAYEDKLNQDSTQKELWIAVQKDTSTLGIVMPNASAGFKPKKGDLFVITGIKPPKVLVTAAEKRLDDALIKHMSENNTDQFNYSVKFSRIFLQENPDFASKLNENAKLSIQIQGDSDSDGNLISHEVFVSNYSVKVDNDELAEVEVELVNSLEVTKSDVKQIIDSVKGETVKSISSMVGGSNTNNFNASITDKMYLSKLTDDIASGTITFQKVQKFLQGLNIGDGKGAWSADGTLSLFKLLTNNFDSGPYGHGAQIDEKGNIEANSIYARQFISAPKFVFNEISVTKAEQWNTNGYGTIESVDVKNRIITLHLEENDYGSLQVGDICRGLYADIDNTYNSDKIEEGAVDECKFVQHKGFFSTYFYVSRIITSEKGKFVFEYGKRSETTPDPCAYMDFAQYGSFTDDKRQSSMYFSSRGNSYIEVLDGVCNWEIYPQNRVCRYGWLGGLAIKKRNGSYIHPSGNGIFVQDNVYFGGTVEYLGDILGLDDLKNEAKAYDVSLSQYQSVVTVDDMGNVINGLYTQDEGKATKQYRISTAVFVRKGMDILLEEDANSEDVTEGHYRLYVVSEDCDVEVKNSTVFVKGIRNIKDGVAGTEDDTNFDYASMRKMSDAMVTIVVELEGKTSKTVQMPIRIQHDSLPFMVCDLSNESASVAWNTKAGKYIGFPIRTKVSLMYHNEPCEISSLNISNVSGLKTSMSLEGKAKVISIDADNLTADTLAQITKMNITVVGKYAGASYEYTRELTILKSSDTVVYELIPSSDSIIVDKDGNKTTNSLSCDVYATSSDDKRYKLTSIPSGMSLKYGKGENATKDLALGAGVDVTSDDKMITFALYDKNNQMLDKESVPVLAFGKDGDGYEYIYYLSDQSESNSIPRPSRRNGVLQPMGWQDDPMEPTREKQYVYVAYKTGEVGSDGSFSEPKLFNRYPKSISSIETWYYSAGSSDINPDPSLFRRYGSQDFSQITFDDVTPWLWIMKITWFTDGDEVINISCGGYKAKDGQDGQDGQDGKDGDGLIVGYQSSASEPSALPTPKTLADYDKAQDDIGHGWTKTAPSTGGKSIVPGGKITTDEIIDRYNSSTSSWGTEESEILLDGIKQKKTFYKTPSSLGDNGKCIRRIKVVNHFRDSYLRVMMKSYSEAGYDLVCISRLYLPSEVINNKGEQIKEDSEYLSRSKYAYAISGDGQSLVAKFSMPDAGEYYFFIGYFKDVSNDYFGDYGLFAWQSMIALTESLWRTDGTVDAVGNITWSKAMPMQAEAIVMERAYIATNNDTEAPAKPYRTNGILQGGWTAKRLAVSSVNRFIWESVRAGKHGTDSVQDDWSQPVIVANFAEAGKMGKNGCIVRNSEGWKSGATYHNDSALTLEQKYIDLIYIEDNNANDGWSIYQCNVTHTATGSSFDPSATDSDGNRLWIKLSDAGPMYSPLIVGKNAVLKFAQGQQFNLMEGNNIFGSFRWVKNNADYAFWIGGVSGDVAKTSITRGGKFKTTDADITGKITAKSGFIGDFTIADGSIKYTSTTKTCELCKDYIQYADTANNQSLYFGYGDSGVKAEFTAKDKNNNDMTCAMISGEDGVNQNKIVAFTTAMTGYTSKLTPYELKLGDYFNTYVQIRVADDISNYGSHRLGKPTTGLKCLVDKKASTLYLFLAGIPSGIPSVATKGMIYEENGVLKIYK